MIQLNLKCTHVNGSTASLTGVFQMFESLSSSSFYLYATLGIVKTNLERIVHRLDLRNPLNVEHVEIRLSLIKDIRGPINFSSIYKYNKIQDTHPCRYMCKIELPAGLCSINFTSLGTGFKFLSKLEYMLLTNQTIVFQAVCGIVVKTLLGTQVELKFRSNHGLVLSWEKCKNPWPLATNKVT